MIERSDGDGAVGATATALLDAAEVAFADRGVDDASLRSIMRAAGANPAAVHYHFGSREALARAVLDRLLAPLQARRVELLDRAVAAGAPEPVGVDALVGALVRPDLETIVAVADRNPRAVRLLGTVYSRPSMFVTSLVEESFAPVAGRFHPHLVAAVPGVGADELSWRIRWVVFGVLAAVLSADEPSLSAETIDAEEARLVTVLAAALAAGSM